MDIVKQNKPVSGGGFPVVVLPRLGLELGGTSEPKKESVAILNI
jgi:hypothetical protein